MGVRFGDHGRVGWRRGSDGDVHYVNGFGGGYDVIMILVSWVLYDFVVSA